MYPKIRLVHLLLNPNFQGNLSDKDWGSLMDRQNKSIQSFDRVKYHFDSYVQSYSNINFSELPVDTCANPEIITTEKIITHDGPRLTYGHYGCYSAHKKGILDSFDENFDAIIVIESDVIIEIPPNEFVEKINKHIKYGLNKKASFITFGELKLGVRHPNPWNEVYEENGLRKVPHFLCAHCYAILKTERERIKQFLIERKWHVFDIWLFWNYDNKALTYATPKRLVTEAVGFSSIDKDYIQKYD